MWTGAKKNQELDKNAIAFPKFEIQVQEQGWIWSEA